MIRALTTAGVVFSAALTLGACGDTKMDRGLSGAGIGAGVGAVGGLLVGEPVAGAVLGGAAGGATGVLTDEDDIDLGDPIWK